MEIQIDERSGKFALVVQSQYFPGKSIGHGTRESGPGYTAIQVAVRDDGGVSNMGLLMTFDTAEAAQSYFDDNRQRLEEEEEDWNGA